MQAGVFPATTPAQREAVFAFRYRIYVEEMNRYRALADHARRWLVEEVDAVSRLYFALEDGEMVASMRLTWGGDAPLPQRQVEQYDLAPFLERLAPRDVVIGERFMVAPAYRGSDVLFRMFCAYLEFVNAHRIQLVFGDCEPHLLNLYQGLGFRTYTDRNVSSPETGYLIPLVMVAEDVDYLRAIGSPLAGVLRDFGTERRVPERLESLLARHGAVVSQRLTPRAAFHSEVFGALSVLEGKGISPFDGLSEAQIERCLEKSSSIACRPGDHVVKKGNPAKNMFIVLAGALEVRDEGRALAQLHTGDVFGEMAFLLGTPRSTDVYAVGDGAHVLSLSESQIRSIIDSDPQTAARLLLNIAKMLCVRLLNAPH